jgi:hypothetical protein
MDIDTNLDTILETLAVAGRARTRADLNARRAKAHSIELQCKQQLAITTLQTTGTRRMAVDAEILNTTL